MAFRFTLAAAAAYFPVQFVYEMRQVAAAAATGGVEMGAGDVGGKC